MDAGKVGAVLVSENKSLHNKAMGRDTAVVLVLWDVPINSATLPAPDP